ncbi:calcium homeostasis modulator protein 6 [Arvicola amphibius]|uniref:calcium homeostasis modulator protein 6 n=1 Tax=Arvicola amphibius TaxID=1047088 RepID=UPI0018E3801A|nr:calcium homeostasis modulator protein 6 [Arvicola amphibius]
MEKLKAVLELQSKHSSALGYGLVTLLTVGGEKIFSQVVFKCPCNATWNLPYGLVFLLVPALALFLLGYALNTRTWRLLTGCCTLSTSSSSRSHSALTCLQISLAASLAPLTWVAVALLGGSFYECAVSGSVPMAKYLCRNLNGNCTTKLPKVPCNKQEAEMQDILNQLKAQSQVIGWILIAVIIIVLLVVTSIIRCCSPISYLHLKFWEIYSQKEEQILQTEATEHATQLAKENVKCFFECTNPKDCYTPSSKAWEKISALYTFNPKNQFYSLLHKYVNRKEMEMSDLLCSREGDTVVAALSFVDASGMAKTDGM